jgi:hypothetical protein
MHLGNQQELPKSPKVPRLPKWKNLTSEETALSIWYLAARATLLELENALPSQAKPNTNS